MKIFFTIGLFYFILWYLIFIISPSMQWIPKLLLHKFDKMKKIAEKETQYADSFKLSTIYTAFYVIAYKLLLIIWLISGLIYFFNNNNNVFVVLVLFLFTGIFKYVFYQTTNTQEKQIRIIKISNTLNIILLFTCFISLYFNLTQ